MIDSRARVSLSIYIYIFLYLRFQFIIIVFFLIIEDVFEIILLVVFAKINTDDAIIDDVGKQKRETTSDGPYSLALEFYLGLTPFLLVVVGVAHVGRNVGFDRVEKRLWVMNERPPKGGHVLGGLRLDQVSRKVGFLDAVAVAREAGVFIGQDVLQTTVGEVGIEMQGEVAKRNGVQGGGLVAKQEGLVAQELVQRAIRVSCQTVHLIKPR